MPPFGHDNQKAYLRIRDLPGNELANPVPVIKLEFIYLPETVDIAVSAASDLLEALISSAHSTLNRIRMLPSFYRRFLSIGAVTVVMTCSWVSAEQSSTQLPLPIRERIGVATHFGIGWHQPERLIPLIKQAGFGWIRDEVPLDQVEGTGKQLVVPERTAKWIALANAAEIKVCLVLTVFVPEKNFDAGSFDPKRYSAAAEFLAKALKGKIQALEILNEPNASGYMRAIGGQWNGREADNSVSLWIGRYVELLNLTAERVKKVNPELTVIGLGAPPPANLRMLKRGVSHAVDGVVDHPYSFRTVPEVIPYPGAPEIITRDGIASSDADGSFVSLIDKLRQQCLATGGERQIWLTEWGFTTYRQNKPQMYQPSTLEAQSAYACRRYLESLALGVRLSVYYDIRDNGEEIYNPEHNFGLLTFANQPKPAYFALKRLFACIADWKSSTAYEAHVIPSFQPESNPLIMWDGSKQGGPVQMRCYRFINAKGNPVLAVWSTDRHPSDRQPISANLEIKLSKPGKVAAVNVTEPVTDKSYILPIQQNGVLVVVRDLPVPAHPLLIELPVEAGTVIATPPTIDNTFDLNLLTPYFNKGAEFSGAEGYVQVRASEGKTELRIAYNFSRGGEYVSADMSGFTAPEKSAALSFAIRAEEPGSLFLRLTDGTGEVHQYSGIEITEIGQWKKITVNLLTPATQSWGGDGDKTLTPPIKSLALGIQKRASSQSIEHSISIRDIRWQ